MMRLRNLSARYKLMTGYVNAVDNVDFTIEPNEIFGIAGESGCGKSTLLKVMYDLIQYPLEISGGGVTIQGTDDRGNEVELSTGQIHTRWWKDISYVPQGAMHVLNPVMKIDSQFLDAVSRYWKRAGNTGSLREKVIDYLRQLDLPPEVMGAYPHQLSGGMKQRILIALATFLAPRVVLADEPTTALDVVVQRGILGMISRVQKANHNSIVIVSHDMGVHYQITNRLGIMYAGQMIEIGKTESMFNAPAHPYTRMLINALPRIGDISQKEGIPGTPPNLKNPPAGCRFAPRCPQAAAMCFAQQPAVTDLGDGHRASCHALTHPDWPVPDVAAVSERAGQ